MPLIALFMEYNIFTMAAMASLAGMQANCWIFRDSVAHYWGWIWAMTWAMLVFEQQVAGWDFFAYNSDLRKERSLAGSNRTILEACSNNLDVSKTISLNFSCRICNMAWTVETTCRWSAVHTIQTKKILKGIKLQCILIVLVAFDGQSNFNSL